MVDTRKGWIRDGLLRVTGVALLACCWMLMNWLFHSANIGQHHDPSFIEFLAATVGFLCFSGGASLTALGAHIFDQVEISQRWAKLPPPTSSGETPSAAFLVEPD